MFYRLFRRGFEGFDSFSKFVPVGLFQTLEQCRYLLDFLCVADLQYATGPTLRSCLFPIHHSGLLRRYFIPKIDYY